MKGKESGRTEKRAGRNEKGVSNPAKVIFKFTHRTMASLSIMILLGGEMAGLYAFHVFVSVSSLVVCVEVYDLVNS